MKAAQVEQLSVNTQADWRSSCCVCVCICVCEGESECVCAPWHGHNWCSLLKLDSLRCHGDSGGTSAERQNFFHGRPHVIYPPPPLHHHHQPCPRAWRRGSTTGPTKSVRASFAGMRRGSWGWSWRAARRMDSSRSSASFSRAERRATAANSSRMNSCWKSTTPRWPDSPPGTSTLWSNTAKTRSDSSVSNKVTFLFFPHFVHFCPQPLANWHAFVFWQQCYCLPKLILSLVFCSVLYPHHVKKINFYNCFNVVYCLLYPNINVISRVVVVKKVFETCFQQGPVAKGSSFFSLFFKGVCCRRYTLYSPAHTTTHTSAT